MPTGNYAATKKGKVGPPPFMSGKNSQLEQDAGPWSFSAFVK